MTSHNRGVYCAPETEILQLRMETIVAASSDVDMPDSGLDQIEGGDPFDNFDPQIW